MSDHIKYQGFNLYKKINRDNKYLCMPIMLFIFYVVRCLCKTRKKRYVIIRVKHGETQNIGNI